MKFKLRDSNGRDGALVKIQVVTKCLIEDKEGKVLQAGFVTLNHRDRFNLNVGMRQALAKTLSKGKLPRDARAIFWKGFEEAQMEEEAKRNGYKGPHSYAAVKKKVQAQLKAQEAEHANRAKG